MIGKSLDPDAELVRELYRPLCRFAAAIGLPGLEPDDLVQEALEHALRIGSLCELDDPLPYLRRAMLNLASNARRSSCRRWRALTRLTRAAEPTLAIYPSDLAMLDAMTPDVRAVLYLAEVEQWTYAEIGDLVGCTEEAARTRSARGRRAMRAVMEADDA
jgi:RNA polymerase sigma-70 factor (ECF subfamily)